MENFPTPCRARRDPVLHYLKATPNHEPGHKTRLVLLGGGHTPVQIIKRWIMSPHGATQLFVVNDRPESVYSGMVPGLVARQYAPHEVSIDLVPLARLAGAVLVLDRVVGIDPRAKVLEFAERPPLPFDIASLDVGGEVRGLELPGVREHALQALPIHHLVDQLEKLDQLIEARRPMRVVVVGGGAAGVELCFALKARCEALGASANVKLLEAGRYLLPYRERAHRARMRRKPAPQRPSLARASFVFERTVRTARSEDPGPQQCAIRPSVASR